jgi:hypothetical protein
MIGAERLRKNGVRLDTILKGDYQSLRPKHGAHAFCGIRDLPRFHTAKYNVYNADRFWMAGGLGWFDDEITVETLDMQAVGDNGFELFPSGNETNIQPSLCQSAAKVSSYRACSKHAYIHSAPPIQWVDRKIPIALIKKVVLGTTRLKINSSTGTLYPPDYRYDPHTGELLQESALMED